MMSNNRDSCPSVSSIVQAFHSSLLVDPLLILDTSIHLKIVYANAAAQELFHLTPHSNYPNLGDVWSPAKTEPEREQLIANVQRQHKYTLPLDDKLSAEESSSRGLCFIWFEVNECPYIAVDVISGGECDGPRTQLKQWLPSDSSYSFLDSLHDSVGVFELDETGVLRVVWFNERALRYVENQQVITNQAVSSLLPEPLQQSWREFERTLKHSQESVACSFLLGEESEGNVCEVFFHPIELDTARRRKQFVANWFNRSKRFQKEMAETQRQQDFYNLVENSPDLIVRYDALGRRAYVNKTYESITGVSRDKVVGKHPLEISGIGKTAELIQSYVMEVLQTGKRFETKLNVDMDHGIFVIHETRLIPEFDNYGQVNGVLLIARDVTQEELAIQRTEVSEKQFRSLVENSPDYIFRFDPECRLVYANPVLARLFHCHSEALVGQNPTQLSEYLYRKFSHVRHDREAILHRYLKAVISSHTEQECEFSTPSDKGIIHISLRLTPEFDVDGHLESILVVGRDDTELKAYQERVEFLSKFDPLTGLPNRVNLLTKVSTRLTGFISNQAKLGLMILGVDHFKNINDSFGYEFGDKVLQALTNKLRDIASSSAYLARIGGDEFGVFLTNVLSRCSFVAEVQRICKALNTTVVIDDSELVITVSVGACMYPDDASDLEGLVRYADSALFAAKSEQRGSVRFYSHELTEKALQRMELRNSIRQAIKNKEFCVYLQPKIRMNDGALVGAEALVRWHHPIRGLVTPDEFIPVAEELGLIGEIDMLVLETLCCYLVLWQPYLTPEQRFAVNLSGLQFNQDDLLDKIKSILMKTNCQTENLELEITEGALLVHCGNLANKINELKTLGFTLALDDFGTGYSSLGYLSHYSIDVLKIDRSFVMDMVHSKSSQVLVKTIVSMAQNLDMKLVAEGVEYLDQANLLQSFGVDVAQGYLYAKPLPADVFADTYHLPIPNNE